MSNKAIAVKNEKGAMDKVLRVLVIDDSAYVRKVVKQMLSRSPFLEVVGTARDGAEALELVEQLNPDVLTLDLMMPNIDGVTFLQKQMARRPIPTVIVSIASENGDAALRALDAGAVDFVQKPTALATDKVFEMADELIEKVKNAAGARLSTIMNPPIPTPTVLEMTPRAGKAEILLIGISTGGPQALKQIIPQFPKNFPVPVAIVMHMPVGYTAMYAEKLNEISNLEVVEAQEGQRLSPGQLVLAQAGRHLTFLRDSEGIMVHLEAKPFDTLHRPSIDVMFKSAVDAFKGRVLGVIMTGMGSDGKEGAAWVKSAGGTIFTEAEESCVVYGMPRSVIEAGLSDQSVTLSKMAQKIMETI